MCHSYLPLRCLCPRVASAVRCPDSCVDACERGCPAVSVRGTRARSAENGNLGMGTRGKKACGVGTRREHRRLHGPSAKAPISRARAGCN